MSTGTTEEQFDVTIFGRTYRISSSNRSKAVTEAIALFIQDYPNHNMPLSVLRKRVETKQVDIQSELLKEHLERQKTLGY